LKTELTGRKIVLMGDSLTRQWYNTLACYLNASGTSFAGWTNGRPAAEQRDKGLKDLYGAALRDGGDPAKWDYNSFTLPDVGAEIAVYVVKETNAIALKLRHAIISYHTQVEKADAIIINEGVHYHDTATLERNLENVLHFCQQEHARCAFRETLPQHFDNPSGLYEKGASGCGPKSFQKAMDKNFDAKASWRNDLLHAALARYPQIPVISIFDEMLPLSFAHPTDKDCTHFVPDMEVWEPLHFKLIDFLRQRFPHIEP